MVGCTPESHSRGSNGRNWGMGKWLGVLTTSLLSTLLLLLFFVAPVTAGDITLFAAASLREAVTELSDNFAKKHIDVKFQKNFGGSGTLAKQIENGAPADLFLSANLEWMDYLKERRLMDDRNIAVLAYNALVFAGRPELKVTRLQDLDRLDRIAMGSPKSVPAGEYAMVALKKAGMDRKLEKKLVMARDVRECLLYADRGEVDGAFVYRTDVEETARKAKILFVVPQEYYSRITYPVGLTNRGARKAEAAEFYRFLGSGEAREILARHGFSTR